MSRQEGLFCVSGNNQGLTCPFKPTLCQEEGSCKGCQIFLDWREKGEILEMCAWCGKEIRRKPGLGQTGVSHGICPECMQEYFGIKAEGDTRPMKRVSQDD